MKNFFENLLGVFLWLMVLNWAFQILTHLPEFLSHTFMLICGLVGFFAVFSAPVYIVEKLLSDNKDAQNGREILKGCAWTILGVFLLGFVSNNDPTGKSSPPPTRTYTHEDFRPTPQSYSAPKSDYRPIELPKAEPLPVLDSLPKTQVPILSKTEPIAPPLVEENLADDEPSLDLPETLDSLESDTRRKDFEVNMEVARQRADAYIEANRDRLEREAELARQRAEAYIEANRDRWEREAQKYINEPIPLPVEQKPISSSAKFNWVSTGIPERSPRSDSFIVP